MKKTIIGIVGIVGCLGAQTFANDCLIVSWNNTQSLIQSYESKTNYHKFLPTESFKIVVANLKAYCCSQVIKCSQEEIANLPKYYPESPYMFDHLIDVSMRRLDGISSLAYGGDVDPMAKFRRETIDEIAANPIGEQAVTIEKTFKTYRSELNPKKINNLEERVLPHYNTENTELLSLIEKYNKLCEINKLLYKDMQDHQAINIGKYGETKSFYRKCENIVRERIQRENQYVKLLMIQKSTQMLTETTKAYTKKHFVEEKLMGLRNLITKVKDYFNTVVQKAPVAKKCN